MHPLLFVAVGSGLLAVFCFACQQTLEFLYDWSFGLVTPGLALLGIAWGVARLPRGRGPDAPGDAVSPGVAAAPALGMAVAGLLIALLPHGSVGTFLLVAGAVTAPFVAGGRMLAGFREPRARLLAAGGAAAGTVLAPIVIPLAGGAVRAGGLVAAAFALAALTASGRGVRLPSGLAAVGALGVGLFLFAAHPDPRVSESSLLKPVLAEIGNGRVLVHDTRWSARGRTDVVSFPADPEAIRWTLTNGADPVPFFTAETPPDVETVRRTFPLTALPFELRRPSRLRTGGSRPGPETRLARSLGISVSPADGAAAEETCDLVFLSLDHTTRLGWTASALGESHRYTTSTFREHWRRLRTGGWLALTSRTERLFVRSLLTVAEAVRFEDGDPSIWTNRAWGFARHSSSADRNPPDQFLLLVVKGHVPGDVVSRLQELTQERPVRVLFGPGSRAVPPYSALSSEPDPARSRSLLREALSRKTGAWLNLEPATPDRSFFFQVLPELHPGLRWLFALVLAISVAALVLPASALRHVDAPEGAYHGPVPLSLGHFLLLGAGTGLAGAALAGRLALAGRDPVTDWFVFVAAGAGGFGLGTSARSPALGARSEGRALAAAGVLLLGLTTLLGLGREEPLFSPPLVRLVAIAGAALVGATGGSALRAGLSRIDVERPPLGAWARVTFGNAALLAPLLALWIGPARGWTFVAGIGTVATLAAGATRAWLARTLPPRDLSCDSPETSAD